MKETFLRDWVPTEMDDDQNGRASKNTLDYLRFSEMHGLKYIADPRRHVTEKVFWTSWFLVALMSAGYLIRDIWIRYDETPVVVSFNAKEIELQEIPFPAITICNMNKIPRSYVERLLKSSKISGEEGEMARNNLLHIKNLCANSGSFAKSHGFASSRGRILEEITSDRNLTKKIYEILIESTPPCNEMIRLCAWNTKRYNCSQLFQTTITSVGKCCSFNQIPAQFLYSEAVLSSWTTPSTQDEKKNQTEEEKHQNEEIQNWKEWNTDEGFLIQRGIPRPYFQHVPGSSSGLSLLLDPNLDSYFCPTSDCKGFNLYFGLPIDEPRMEQFGKTVGVGNEIFVEIVPTINTARPDIKDFDWRKRQCLFPEERKLKFYKSYTQLNCLEECKSIEITTKCSCVPYYIIRFFNVSICSSNPSSFEYKCYHNATRNFNAKQRQLCGHCSNLCADLDYHSRMSFAKLQNSSKLWLDFVDTSKTPEWATNKMTLVHFYFKLDVYHAHLRRELFGKLDLIANMGNVLTLCLGFSVLSGVEFVYFFTVRIFWNYIRSRLTKCKTRPKNEISVPTIRYIRHKFSINIWNRSNINMDKFVQHELQAYRKFGAHQFRRKDIEEMNRFY